MESLLKFVDDFVFEKQLYFRLRSIYTRKEYEVQWQNQNAPKWRMRPVGDADWIQIQSSQLIQELNSSNLDIRNFELQLRTSVLYGVAYADTFKKAAIKQFGEEVVNEAIKANEEFMDELSRVVHEILGPGHTPRKKDKDQSKGKFSVKDDEYPRLVLRKAAAQTKSPAAHETSKEPATIQSTIRLLTETDQPARPTTV